MKIIWCMLLEIWSMTDIIFSHFGPFFALLPPNNPENQNFERWKKCQEISLFHTSIPQIDPKNKNFKPFLKTWRYYPITYVYHKWRYLMYDSWDMKHDRQNFLSFWAIVCLFTALTIQKIKILKRWKNTPEDIIISYKCTKDHDHLLYSS